MASETPKATDVIWINLDEYYYVCDSCSESWRGMSWFPLTSFANNWEERNKPIYEELEGSDRPCDLCRYDIDEFVQEVIDRNLDPEEIPEVIKGDVLERIKEREQTLGGRETDVLDNYSKDEIPKSLHKRQLEFSKNLTGFWLEKKPKKF